MLKSAKGFYVGDICYVLGDEVYDGVWGANGYKDGVWTDPASGLEFAVAGTAYGDGLYFDQQRREYSVDAGVIGVVPLELVAKEDGLKLGVVVMGHEATFDAEDGHFEVVVGSEWIEINTEEDDPDEEWYPEDEESDMGYDPYLGCYTDDV